MPCKLPKHASCPAVRSTPAAPSNDTLCVSPPMFTQPSEVLDDYGHPTALAWQYARDGWAVAQWSGPRPAQLTEVAARVRYRSDLHLPFPFRLTGIPGRLEGGRGRVPGRGGQADGSSEVTFDSA